MARLRVSDRQLLQSIATQSRVQLHKFDVPKLVSTAWAVAKLTCKDAPLFDAIADYALPTLDKFLPHQLANTAWAFATVAFSKRALMQAISAATVASLPANASNFQPLEIVNTAWAFAKLGVSDKPLMAAIATAAVGNIGHFAPNYLATMAWSFAAVAFVNPPLLNAIAIEAVARIHLFNVQSLSQMAWAVATMRFENDPLMSAIAGRARNTQATEFAPQSLSNLAWSFATLRYCDGPFMNAISSSAQSMDMGASPLALSGISWAFAELGVKDAPLFDALAAATIVKVHACSVRVFSSIAWAFAELEMKNQPLWDAISDAAIQKMTSSKHSETDLARAAVSLAEAFSNRSQACEQPVLRAAETAVTRHCAKLDGFTSRRDLDGGADSVVATSDLGNHPRVLLERKHHRVLWKPPRWRILAGSKSIEGDVIKDAGELREWVAEKFGSTEPVALSDAADRGLTHRLDFETSGALLAARTFYGFWMARLAFATNVVRKEYLCLCEGHFPPRRALLRQPIQTVRHSKSKLRSVVSQEGRPACTEILEVAHLETPEGAPCSLVRVLLHTGRQHQIRVHMAAEGHPLLGDASYGRGQLPWCGRNFLHARLLRLGGPIGPVLSAKSGLPPDLREALASLRALDPRSRGLDA